MGGDTQVNDLVVEWYLAISMIVRGSKDKGRNESLMNPLGFILDSLVTFMEMSYPELFSTALDPLVQDQERRCISPLAQS